MSFIKAVPLVLILLSGVHCLDPYKEAHTDLDLGVQFKLGQRDFPQEWQRELMARTALDRLLDANVLTVARKPTSNSSTWNDFCPVGVYEALLNMVRITSFQMYTEGWPNSWSMWGLEQSVPIYANEPQYAAYREASKGYPFEYKSSSSRLEQVTMANIMAAKWEVNFKGKVAFYDKPFYSIRETVEAVRMLRDPTSYFKGNQTEGEAALHTKLIELSLPVCRRDLSIAIAFDTYGYTASDMTLLNDFIGGVFRHTPNSNITIRGTSKLQGGFAEGAVLDRLPKIVADPNAKHFEILTLVNSSIFDLRSSVEFDLSDTGRKCNMRARALFIISKLKNRKDNKPLAGRLSGLMDEIDVLPLFLNIAETDEKNDDVDMLTLLGRKIWRGHVTGSADPEVVRMILRRMLRLVCEAPNHIETSYWMHFNIHDRIHLTYRHDLPERRAIAFRCNTYPHCEIDIYAHHSRWVNELFHDSHNSYKFPYMGYQLAELVPFSDGRQSVHFVVVTKTPCVLSVIKPLVHH